MWEGKVDSNYVREWITEDNKANIIIIHGVGEHSGRYIEAAEKLFEQGFNVYTGDLVGHGLSEGYRVFINSIMDYLTNVDFFINRIQNNKPIFLLGHSMGGLIVLYYMLFKKTDNIKGVIATSPYIKDKISITALKYSIGKIAAKYFPKLHIESGLKGEMLCNDKSVAQKYNNDVLNCSKVTAKWFIQMEKARQELVQQQEKFVSPCLILQAAEDLAVDPKAAEQFYEGISSQDKEFVLYEGFYHEILNDPGRDKVIEKIITWSNNRL